MTRPPRSATAAPSDKLLTVPPTVDAPCAGSGAGSGLGGAGCQANLCPQKRQTASSPSTFSAQSGQVLVVGDVAVVISRSPTRIGIRRSGIYAPRLGLVQHSQGIPSSPWRPAVSQLQLLLGRSPSGAVPARGRRGRSGRRRARATTSRQP